MEKHDTLLIACGSRKSRKQLRSVLQGQFNLLEATNTRQMILLLEQNMDCIASVVLDISNWDVIDKNLLNDTHAIALLQQVPVVVIADKESYQDLTLYFRYGAADVLPLNYDPYAMLHRIETISQLTLYRKHLERVIEEQKENIHHFTDNMVDALSSIIEYRDTDSGHHILRIRNFTQILLEEVMRHCPEYGLTDRLVTIMSSASALHDVGKIGIPDAILNKPGKLTPEEWEIMQTHSVLGCKMLGNLVSTVDRDYLNYAYQICRHHHERWDGRGYPDGLKGDEIPICAQVVGLADCYDALTSDRVYKAAYTHARAVNMILGGECGAFSPKLLECFKNTAARFSVLSAEYSDGRDPGQTLSDLSLPAPAVSESNAGLMEKTQAKYYSMVHYLNAFLVEVQLDTGLFQVIYNPYPDLAHIQGASSLRELTDIVACQIVVPEERERMYQVIWEEIPAFVRQDLRRKSFYFRHRPYADEPGGPFEMTFLRIGSLDRKPSLAILCRKISPPQGRSFEDGSIMVNFTECTYVCRNDSRFTLVRVGKDTHSLGGYTPEEVMEIFGGRLLDMAFPEDQEQIRQEFDRQLKDGPMVRTEYRFICKDGSVGWVVNKSRLVIGDDGQEYIQTFLIDITASKTAYEKLRKTLHLYQTILAQTENVLFDLDVVDSRIEFSDTWEAVFGYKPSDASFSHQLSGETHVHPDDIPLLLDRLHLLAQGSDYETVEIRIATAKGRYLWCRVRGSAVRDADGKLVRVLGVILNIDSEKETLQALEDKASRDSLTRLLNKNAGHIQVEQYLSRHGRESRCALIILDLDNFKDVNDHYGHLFGDALLTQVSRILSSLFHSHDILSRIGGDEFMVLVQGVTDRQLLASQCRRLRDMLLHVFHSETLDLGLGCSIGIALCPEHGDNYYELFAKADQALYQAKSQGKNDFCFYSDGSRAGYLPASHSTTPIDSDRTAEPVENDLAYRILQLLYQSENVEAGIQKVLAIMGQQTDVSRVYIFENSEDGSYCRNTFEWCNEGITPQIHNLQHVSYSSDIPGYQNNFNEGGVFYCHDVRELSPSAYALAAPQGIRSMLHCAIHHQGQYRGYIGFDACNAQRFWTKVEIGILTAYSRILTLFLMNYREQQKRQTLPAAPAQWTCTVDPTTWELKEITGNCCASAPGQLCYRTLMNRDTPCENCPVISSSGRERGWAILPSAGSDEQILAEAVPVLKDGQHLYQVTCRRLPNHS